MHFIQNIVMFCCHLCTHVHVGTKKLKIHETFFKRKDFLDHRITDARTGQINDSFRPGRQKNLKGIPLTIHINVIHLHNTCKYVFL